MEEVKNNHELVDSLPPELVAPVNEFDKTVEQVLAPQLEREQLFFMMRFMRGKLSFREFKGLSTRDQDYYRKRHGRPDTPVEINTKKKNNLRNLKLRKAQRKSRRINAGR